MEKVGEVNMKKTGTIILCLICIFVLVACSSDQKEMGPNVSYAEMLPSNDIFKTGKFNIIEPDGGKAYAFSVSDFTDAEVAEYISQCKKLGFNNVSYEIDSRFGSYSTDGEYWVEVVKESNGTLTIICKKSIKN